MSAAPPSFATPNAISVPGARELGALVPFYFVDEGYEEEEEEEDGTSSPHGPK